MPLDNLSELKRRVPGGKYTLARAIAERARQLQSGQVTPLVEVRTPNPLSVAIDEIVQGKINFRFGADAMPAGEAAEAALAAEKNAPAPIEEILPVAPKPRANSKAAKAAAAAAAEAEAAEAAAVSDDSTEGDTEDIDS